jgi:N-acetylglutamate synthase-like GNAT family acetyltransferase
LSGQWSVVSGQFKVRKAKEKDLKAIFKLRKDWGRKNYWIKSSEGFFVLEKVDKKIKKVIGTIALLKKDEMHNEIVSFVIGKKYRGKNLGNLLLNKVIEECPQSKVYALSDLNFKNYYLEKGFEELKIMPKAFADDAKICKAEYNENSIALMYDKHKHISDSSFTSIPDLIVIDGGQGQLTSAEKALKTSKLNIPIISLAKREEEIIFKTQSSRPKAQSLMLEKTSLALQLLQRIRDEAHRFAITFNKNQRLKELTHSKLDEIKGIGTETKTKLLQTFASLEGIRNADYVDLKDCIGEDKAKIVKEMLNQ